MNGVRLCLWCFGVVIGNRRFKSIVFVPPPSPSEEKEEGKG